MGTLPASQPVIRVIYTGGMTKVLNVKNCRSADEIVTVVLKKLGLSENQYRNYCFYVLDGLDPNPQMTRRISDGELMRICAGGKDRSERNRLILRKIHAGEPDSDELRRASQIAYEESQIAHTNAISSNSQKSQAKLQKLTGETWDSVKYPMSPAPFLPSERGRSQTASTMDDTTARRGTIDGRDSELGDYDLPDSPGGTRRGSNQKLRQFFGGRPDNLLPIAPEGRNREDSPHVCSSVAADVPSRFPPVGCQQRQLRFQPERRASNPQYRRRLARGRR
jgi:hypothetical protein